MDARSDPFTAYCLDEAVFMWGTYVEGEISKAEKEAKTTQQAKNKIKLVIHRLLKEDEDEYRRDASKDAEGNERALPPVKKASGKFRDPMSVVRPE